MHNLDAEHIVIVKLLEPKHTSNIDVCETRNTPLPNLSRIGLTFELSVHKVWETNMTFDLDFVT